MSNKLLSYILLIILSAIGSFITIPSQIGTIAFDSIAGFLAAGLISPISGGIIGAIGHFVSAIHKGFPLGVMPHILISLMMAMAVIIYGYLFRQGRVVTSILVGTLLNGPIALIPFIFIIDLHFFFSLLVILTTTAFVNIVLATITIPYFNKVKE